MSSIKYHIIDENTIFIPPCVICSEPIPCKFSIDGDYLIINGEKYIRSSFKPLK